MNQIPLFRPIIWSVSQITRYVRELFEDDSTVQDVWIQGEISNLSRPGSGHLYFTIKDNNSSLRCVMWRNSVIRQSVIPKNGDSVEVHGGISVYEVAGQYQLYVDAIRLAGAGDLFQEFIRLKNRLEEEGLFEIHRKRALPRWPDVIGIVTSPSGAALRDILNTLQRRYPIAKVILAPTVVQGLEAPAGIIKSIHNLNSFIHPDLIILARGGGSIEDLWAFNDEALARAIAASQAPIISGIGHETDFTIADFVSDLRAPTPTAAAELATPDQADLIPDLLELGNRMYRLLQANINHQQWEITKFENRLALLSPRARMRSDRQRLDELATRVGLHISHRLNLESTLLKNLGQQLTSLNPEKILSRGYALVRTPGGKIVQSIHQVAGGDALTVQVSDGAFDVKVSSDR